MPVTVDQIKQLREITDAPIMDCRRALEQSSGDIESAKKLLLEWGINRISKKTDRETNQGQVVSYVHSTGKIGSLVELVCETDFVARNEEFRKLGLEIAMQVASMNPKTVEELLDQAYIRDSSRKIVDLVSETIAKFGENAKITRFARFEIGKS